MTAGFRHFAELWREQIGPEELAEFQARAKKIARSANLRSRLDFALSTLAIGATGLFLWAKSTSPQVKLGFALLAAGAIWFAWRRHQIAKASRAIAVDDPSKFFETAIKNLRAEIRLSTISLYSIVPTFTLCYFMMSSTHGVYGLKFFLIAFREENFVKTMVIGALFLLGSAYLLRDYIKLREQLRRLESMSREWDDQPARDVQGGP